MMVSVSNPCAFGAKAQNATKMLPNINNLSIGVLLSVVIIQNYEIIFYLLHGRIVK